MSNRIVSAVSACALMLLAAAPLHAAQVPRESLAKLAVSRAAPASAQTLPKAKGATGKIAKQRRQSGPRSSWRAVA